MKKLAAILAGCLLVCAVSAQAAPALRLAGNRLVLENKGKATTLSTKDFPVEAVKDAQGKPLAGLRYCGIGAAGGKAHGLAPGLYLFDATGRMTAFAPTEAAEFCAEVRLSPGATVLAMDSGTWLVRSWFFLSYPGMKPLGEVAYYQAEDKPALLWEGDDGALFSSMETQGHKRICDYDPCGPVSVRAYSFKTRKATTLLAGTDLCDYTLTGFTPKGGMVAADKRCLPSAKAWKAFPQNVPAQRITVKEAVAGP
ncbi:hypothetical protein [Solidesulfovibrio sp. C21]|uniref:hypothetical protein n=1 Tax=Solidesulfovibrio sp. C21 TaxID=3398613 RepID=UPI0039FBE2D0